MSWFYIRSTTLSTVLRWGIPCAKAQGVKFYLYYRAGLWHGQLWVPIQFPQGGLVAPHAEGLYIYSDYVHLVPLRSGKQYVPYWSGIYTWDGQWQHSNWE